MTRRSPRRSAKHYRLTELATDVADTATALTRFVLVATAGPGCPDRTGNDKNVRGRVHSR